MDKLHKCNRWMFSKVKCRAYMKKINDGKFVKRLGTGETENGLPAYFYVDLKRKNESGTGEWEKEVEEICGDLDFLKTYYERTERNFVGVVVGMKMVSVSAYLYVDTVFDIEGCDIGEYIGREVKERKKCALVYFGCNKSRLVPLEDLEIIDKGELE